MITASIVARAGWIIPDPFAMPPIVKPAAPDRCRLGARVGRQDRVGGRRAPLRHENGGRLFEPRPDLRERQWDADHAGGEDEHLVDVEVEQPCRLRGSRDRVELPALAGGRVGRT